MIKIISQYKACWHAAARQVFPIAIGLSLLTSCAYHFGSSSIQIPAGIRSLSVEAVYDTSREIFPHEILWSAMQQQIARSGRLVLTSQEEADAILRIWVQQARVNPSGTASREPLAKDPPPSKDAPGRPDEYRNLRRAGSWTTDENVSFTVEVELHDLKSQKLLKRQAYSFNNNFKSLRPVTITSTASGYLHYEEAMEAKVKELSNQLSQRVVVDFSL